MPTIGQCTYVDSLRLLLPSEEYILPKATPDHVQFFQFATEGVKSLSSVNGRRTLYPSVPPKLTVDDQESQEIYEREYCKNLDDPNLCEESVYRHRDKPRLPVCPHEESYIPKILSVCAHCSWTTWLIQPPSAYAWTQLLCGEDWSTTNEPKNWFC